MRNLLSLPVGRLTLAAAVLAGSTLASGCAEYAGRLGDVDWQPATLAQAGPWVHALHPTRRAIWVFDATTNQVESRRLDTAGQPLRVAGTNDHVWVLTARPSVLHRFDVRTGARADWPLPAAYTRIAVRDDGRFVTAWYGIGDAAQSDDVLFNANQVSIIDTATTGTGGVRTLGLNGVRPVRFEFPAPFPLASGAVPYATAVGQQGLAFVRLEAGSADNAQRVVPFGFAASNTTLQPNELVFVDDESTGTTICLASAVGSPLVFAIDMAPGDAQSGRELQPAVNVLTLPSTVTSMTPFVVDGATRLLLTMRSNRIAIVDPVSASTSIVTLDAEIARVVPWVDTSAGGPRNRALLLPSSGAWVGLAELDALDLEGATGLRIRRVANRVGSAELIGPEGAPDRALLRYANGSGIGLLDLERGTETPLPAQVAITDALLTPAAILAGVPGSARLAAVDTATAIASTIDITAPALSLLHVAERDVLVLTHEESAGWYTFLPASNPTAAPIAEIRGIYLENLLNEGGRR